jgi:hypothetical protein
MRISDRMESLVLLCLLFLAGPLVSQSLHAKASSANVVSVNAAVGELLDGYLGWTHKHPELRPGSGSKLAQPGKAGAPYRILWPTLDIYSATGASLYHGNDSEGNVKVVRALPQLLPKTDAMQIRPTLEEAEAMFPELSHERMPSSARIKYTVFVVNYAKRPACNAQDEAIQQLKKRVAGSRIRVVEVRIN